MADVDPRAAAMGTSQDARAAAAAAALAALDAEFDLMPPFPSKERREEAPASAAPPPGHLIDSPT
eukprot:9296911-Pyramimonas_sp.AAC.1